MFSFSGEIIDPKHRCKKCKGKKVVEESKILEVFRSLLSFFLYQKQHWHYIHLTLRQINGSDDLDLQGLHIFNASFCDFQVQVEKGMKDEQKVTFRGEGDQQVVFIDVPNQQLLFSLLLLRICFGFTRRSYCVHSLFLNFHCWGLNDFICKSNLQGTKWLCAFLLSMGQIYYPVFSCFQLASEAWF